MIVSSIKALLGRLENIGSACNGVRSQEGAAFAKTGARHEAEQLALAIDALARETARLATAIRRQAAEQPDTRSHRP